MSYYQQLAADDWRHLVDVRDGARVPAGAMAGLTRRGLVTSVMGSYLLTPAGERRLVELEGAS